METVEGGAVYIALGPIESGYWDAVFYGSEAFEHLGLSLAPTTGGFWVGAPGYDSSKGAVWKILWE